VSFARAALLSLLVILVAASPAGAFAGRNGVLGYEGKASAKHQLVLRNPDGSGTRVLRTRGRPSRPAFSPQGVRVAFASRGQIWVAQANGSALRQVTTAYYAANGDPAWSPAGDALAFTSGPSGGRDILVIGADGNALRRLTANDADETSPAWSSTDAVAFVRHTEAGDGDIWAVAGSGGSARRLTSGPADDRDPSWSPDGRRLAFTRNTPRHRDVYVANRLGHRVRKLRSLPAPASTPVWSPNGRWIAFAMGRNGRRGIYLMRTNGHRLRRVVKASTDARALDWQVRPGDPVLAGAGDIACDPSSPFFNDGFGSSGACHQFATSDELLKMDLSGVLMLGDAQYEDGALAKFRASYDPSWGRLKSLTHPVIGNHEYFEPTASGYWDYFDGVGRTSGRAGPRGLGWYSFDVGAWHVVALNSNCNQVSCAAGGPQERWLRTDLAAHPARCTLALMHHPLVSSGAGDEGSTPAVHDLWQALYDGGADLMLVGHDHAYERFAPLNPARAVDPVRGIREIVVGTGGKNEQIAVVKQPGSEVRSNASFGVIRLTLHASSYDWAFQPDAPGGFSDAGSAACH
jgi:acid phosphatase type 7